MKTFLSPVLLSPSRWLFMRSRVMGALYCRPLGLEEVLKGYCIYLCVRNQHIILVCCGVKRHNYYYAICVYRCAYQISFRVWFWLRGLLVREVGPENCLQSLGIDVAWLTSFKVASSDIRTMLKWRTWSCMVDYWKFVVNHAPLTQRMPYRHRYIFDRPALPLFAPSVEKLLGPLERSHNYACRTCPIAAI